jgi:serine/threonine protein kinase
MSVLDPILKRKLKIQDKISAGAYGTIFETSDPKYACKVYHIEKSDSDSGYTRDFLREISALSILSGSNYIAQLYGVKAKNCKSVCIFLQRYAKDLKTLIDERQEQLDDSAEAEVDPIAKLPPEVTKKIIYQVLIGLYNAQLKGISHRDIKPTNILIDDDYNVAICDWGLSRFLCTDDPECFTEEVITLWYRPPEILLGGQYTFSVDVWSVGVMLCELINGMHFLTGRDEQDQLNIIFKKLGYPNRQTWKGVENLLHFPSTIINNKVYPLSHHLLTHDQDCLDLVQGMLKLNPNERITILDAINHPYFDSIRSETKLTLPKSLLDPFIEMNPHGIRPNFMKSQTRITSQSRVHMIKLIQKTLSHHPQKYSLFFKSCYYFDLFLSSPSQITDLRDLIPLALSCLWLASKLIAIETLDGYELAETNGLSIIDLIEMERKIVRQFSFNLYRPTEDNYLALIQQLHVRLTSKQEKMAYQLLSSYVYDVTTRSFKAQHLALMVYFKVLCLSPLETNDILSLISMTKSEYIEISQYIRAFDRIIVDNDKH